MLTIFLLSTGVIFVIISSITGEELFMIGLVIPTLLLVILSAWFPELLPSNGIAPQPKNRGNVGKIISYRKRMFEIKEVYTANGIKKYKCKGLGTAKDRRLAKNDKEIQFVYNDINEYRNQKRIQRIEDERKNSNKLK